MADDQVVIVKVRGWQRALYVSIIVGLMSLPIMAVATAISARNTSNAHHNAAAALEVARQIEESSECRFDENAEISDLNDLIDYWFLEGFKASVRDDQERLEEALREGERLAPEFLEAINDRGSIAERCSATIDGEPDPAAGEP